MGKEDDSGWPWVASEHCEVREEEEVFLGWTNDGVVGVLCMFSYSISSVYTSANFINV